MRTSILRQIPYFDTPRLVAADQLALIWVNNDIIDRRIVLVLELDPSTSLPSAPARQAVPSSQPRDLLCIPYSDGRVLASCDYPFPLRRVCQRRDVPCVSFEG